MTKCGTGDRWYHMSCEDGHFHSTDWKCKTCNTSNTIDMEQKVEHIYVDDAVSLEQRVEQIYANDAVSPLSDSSNEQDSVELTWKQLVNCYLREHNAALLKIDLQYLPNVPGTLSKNYEKL